LKFKIWNLILHYTTIPLYDYTSLPFTAHHRLTTDNGEHTTQDTCHFEWFSIENRIEKCFNVRCFVEFSIQWLWSIATNPSLELTFKCGFDTIFQKKNHSATGPPVYQPTTHDTCHFEWFSIENCIEKCFNVRYSIEFSIQWLWSIAANPSLELTGTTYYFTTILIHHYTITPVHPLRDSLDTESV
jgi:hypothetical protein